jgi:hypothetical protein
MVRTTRKRTGELVRKVFEILLAHPQGLAPEAVLRLIEQSLHLTEFERGIHPSLFKNYELIARFGTIAPVKAGWLISNNGRWCVSEEGKRAYARYDDPERFMIEAGRLSIKGWLSVHLPRFYSCLIKAADQVMIEFKLVRRVGLGVLIRRAFGVADYWQKFLPLQTIQRIALSGVSFTSADELMSYLRSIGVDYVWGGHTVYIPPCSIERSAFRELLNHYPPGFGIKISRNPGGVNRSTYFFWPKRKGASLMHSRLIYDHRHLSLVANLLYVEGLGPRLYDLIELQCDDQVWTAYIIEHVRGRVPSLSECNFGLKRLRKLEEGGLIKINAPDGYSDEDFQPPTCNGNAFVSEVGQFHYIDFQNFFFPNYESYLKSLVQRAVQILRSDDPLLLRPNLTDFAASLSSPAEDKADRGKFLLADLLESNRVPVKGKLVLNINCGSGMAMAEYLSLGARWCHGWDEAGILRYTEKLLLALGCTRFSLTNSDEDCHQEIKSKLPEFLHPHLNGCIVSYNDADGDLGWLCAISQIPMSFLIYEASGGFELSFKRLKAKLGFEVIALASQNYGRGSGRSMAILARSF